MSQLVDITITNRGANLDLLPGGPTLYGFDVDDIVSPIRYSSGLSKSYFTARTNKGGPNNNSNGSKIDYQSSNSLAVIAAKSSLFLLLNVVSRRGVDEGGEAYIFVSSKITESLVPTPDGTLFYYIEDGDPLPVEYIVSQTIPQIIAASGAGALKIQDDGTDMPPEQKLNFVGYTVEDNPSNNSTDIIAVKPIEYSDLLAIHNAGNLPLGAQYLIIDRGDAGIIVEVSAPNTISLRAKGLYLVPDFQDVGDYSGLTNPKGTNHGVWILSNQGTYSNNDIVFWNGIMYQVIDDTQFGSNDPESNSNAYASLTKNVTNGYILESHSLSYDVFDTDSILERKDKRGNIVNGPGNFFQWGNDNVEKNVDQTNIIDCINQRGQIQLNIVNSTRSVYVSNLFTASIRKCYFGVNANVVLNDCILSGCVFNSKNVLFELSNGVSFIEKAVDELRSTFNADLDMSDASVFSAGELNIPTELNYIGEFTLINNTGQTISKIVNLPDTHRTTRFYSESGNTQSFQHVAVAGAVADTLNADAVSTNAIIGRSDGSDFIEYERSGIKNIRTNIVKLA